eukprot:m.47072 g.47072  ORF g.47072 m.47072 type:complete len:98 (+) comp10446_c0_seq2:2227-2520(+)
MISTLLAFTTSPGQLGMLVSHEGANWPSVFGSAVQTVKNFLAPPCTTDLSTAICYKDPNFNRTFPYTAWISAPTSQEICARACHIAGSSLSYNCTIL